MSNELCLLCVTDLPTFYFESRNWALWKGQKNNWNFSKPAFIESDRVFLEKKTAKNIDTQMSNYNIQK